MLRRLRRVLPLAMAATSYLGLRALAARGGGSGTVMVPAPSLWVAAAVLMGVATRLVCDREPRRRPVVGLMLTVALALGGYGLATYTEFTERGILIHRLGGTVAEPYGAVAAIRRIAYRQAWDRRMVPAPYFVIDFRDGVRWSTIEGWRADDVMEDGRVMRTVSRRSGVPVVPARFP